MELSELWLGLWRLRRRSVAIVKHEVSRECDGQMGAFGSHYAEMLRVNSFSSVGAVRVSQNVNVQGSARTMDKVTGSQEQAVDEYRIQ